MTRINEGFFFSLKSPFCEGKKLFLVEIKFCSERTNIDTQIQTKHLIIITPGFLPGLTISITGTFFKGVEDHGLYLGITKHP